MCVCVCVCVSERDIWGARETPFEKKNEKESKRRLRARIGVGNRCAKFYGVVREKSVQIQRRASERTCLASRQQALPRENLFSPVTATTYPDAFTFPRPSIQFLIVCRMAATKPRRLSLPRLNRLCFSLHSASQNSIEHTSDYRALNETFVTIRNFCQRHCSTLAKLSFHIVETVIVSTRVPCFLSSKK